MKKILIFSSLLLINDVSAQSCIPKPDCADMGYSDTSCDGAYLKCPFDTSKLICLEELIIKSTQDCAVGMYYYSDGTCYSEYYTSKTLVGIVVKENALVMSAPTSMVWGNYGTDVSGLTNISSSSTAKTDMNGKSNTSIIASEHSSSGLTSSNSAAIYCNSYSTDGTSAGDWYLPAAGELYSYVYGNYSVLLSKANAASWSNFESSYFWSSSEYSSNFAWDVGSSSGAMGGHLHKNTNGSVSCLLAL